MSKLIRPFFVPSILLLISSAVLVSCNIPVPTEVLLTAADTPTATQEILASPTAGTTETPGGNCDQAQFITDLSYPDNTVVKANDAFTKTWKIQNAGTCTWDSSYKLVFIRGEKMESQSPADAITTPVNPGDTVELSIPLKASSKNGSHWGVWQLYNGSGNPIIKADGKPQELSVLILVQDGTGGTVTEIRGWRYTFVGVKCASNTQYDVWTSIHTDGPVDVGYVWSTNNGLLTTVSGSFSFTDGGSQEFTTHISPPFADPNNIEVTLTANSSVQSSFTICP